MYHYGREMYDLAAELFPICRSLTGNGVRQTFEVLKKYYEGIKLYEVPTGTQVFDWTVPNEWNITDGFIADESGRRIVDFQKNNLHIMGYSAPMDAHLSLEELQPYLYTLPEQPDVIPYMTSYYKERSGFCLTENLRQSLPEGTYHACIRSRLEPGSLTYGEILLPGESQEEIFISTYVCHPSMANNECSGPSLAIWLARWLSEKKHRRYSYRIVLAPETIGAITYLSRNLPMLKERVIAGFNLSCVGDDRTYSMVRSRYGDTLADKVLSAVLACHAPDYHDYPYTKRGSDERQYCAPGVDLPLVGFCRSKYHEFPEYHTAADNMDIVSPAGFGGSFEVMAKCIESLEFNRKYQVTCICEPQLGKRGLVPTLSNKETFRQTLAMKDILAYADGSNDIYDLSRIIGVPVELVITVLKQLLAADLVKAVE